MRRRPAQSCGCHFTFEMPGSSASSRTKDGSRPSSARTDQRTSQDNSPRAGIIVVNYAESDDLEIGARDPAVDVFIPDALRHCQKKHPLAILRKPSFQPLQATP